MKATTISHRLLSCFQIYNLVSSVGRNRFHLNRRAILGLPSVSQLFTAYLLLEVVILAFKLTRCRYLVHVTIVTVCCLCHSVCWSAQDRTLDRLGHSTSFVIVGLVWAASCGLILPILAGAIRRPPFLIRVVRTACSSVVDTADAFFVKLGQDARVVGLGHLQLLLGGLVAVDRSASREVELGKEFIVIQLVHGRHECENRLKLIQTTHTLLGISLLPSVLIIVC